MPIEIVNALVELVKTGGNYALWGIFMWGVLTLFKLLAVVLVIGYSVKVVCHSLLQYSMGKHKKIILMSEDLSKRIEILLKEFTEEVESVVTRLDEKVNKLSK